MMDERKVRTFLGALALLLVAPNVAAQWGPPPNQQPPPQQYPPQQYPPQQYPPQQYPPQQYPPQQYPPQYPPPGYGPNPAAQRSNKRDDVEIGFLYTTAAMYGVGTGIWFSAEVGLDDPALFLIPPALLGVAAPIGVYFLDDPEMPRGMPASISAGLAIGAGEGIGITSYQFVTADEDEEWGYKGLFRGTTLGATLGGVGGYAVGYYLEPSPKSTLLTTSAVLWGASIGTMFGYGGSEKGVGYGVANDQASLGGLIGYNIGLAGGAAASALYIPSWEQIGWMWGGAGVGVAVSLPIFLFYTGDDGPPAKRGFLFMGTTTTLGIAAGAIFGSGEVDEYEIGKSDPSLGPRIGNLATLTTLAPMVLPEGGGGITAGGFLD